MAHKAVKLLDSRWILMMAGDIEENPGPTLSDKRRTLKLKLESEFQHLHNINWKLDEKESPLVIKFKDHGAQKVEAEIRKWVKTITKVTGQKVVQDPQLPYIRINLVESDLTMFAFMIFGVLSSNVVFS